MDDGDGSLPIEMMAGQPAQAILQTIYNGSGTCSACGCLMSPVVTMYSGSVCPECAAQRGSRRIKNRMGE